MSVRVPRLSYEDVRRSADAFLGEHHLVLAPREPLHEAYRAARRAADEAGIDIETNVDVARYYVSTSIAQTFGVSAGVIDRRLVREGILPRNTTMG